jgi:hypothetical protein
MRQAVIRTSAGEAVFDLGEPGDFPSFFVFAMHKSGSVLINRMLDQALSAAGIPQIPLAAIAFRAGLPEREILNPEELIFERGYCYRSFRGFPPYLRDFDISRNKKVLLIRDPRDITVSYYFSMAKSHSLPPSGIARKRLLGTRAKAVATSIDEFCCNIAKEFTAQFRTYQPILPTELRVYRYEDVIFDKRGWLADMLDYFGVALDREIIAATAREHDIWPEEERPLEHIRQVKPGNFRKHLSRDSIDRLNAEFEPMLREYNYAF